VAVVAVDAEGVVAAAAVVAGMTAMKVDAVEDTARLEAETKSPGRTTLNHCLF
jgi:hypothetical protein